MNYVVMQAIEGLLEPDSKVHDWRNYLSDELKAEWHTFNEAQQATIAKCLSEIAENEHWD